MVQTFYKRLYFAIVGQDSDPHMLEVRNGEGLLETTEFTELIEDMATGVSGVKPVATGTAVLVAGTKVVTDASITANSVIRLSSRTVGGTPGAVYVSARTASTSFAITSTSNTDTSTYYYEVLSY